MSCSLLSRAWAGLWKTSPVMKLFIETTIPIAFKDSSKVFFNTKEILRSFTLSSIHVHLRWILPLGLVLHIVRVCNGSSSKAWQDSVYYYMRPYSRIDT
ncbi:predicted protein [Arabidopsis lyrata subsp. lyrata]|uniref:Predicted protein n=1 Tax=Arabidopsis lyrata subsp. lyrata TaxID=81972 RepID=D7MNX9_ARALL|nr:predicted protein [Arabidopsis lyrata subsp. lyrata]